MEEGPSPRLHPRKPWAAGLLSLWVPGLGQLYSGHWKRALGLWLGGPLLLAALAFARLPSTFPGLFVWCLVAVLYLLWVAWDAARLARRAGSSYRLRPFNRWYLYLLLGLAVPFALRPLMEHLPIRSFRAFSGSMEPAVRAGDRFMVDLTRWRQRQPSRGDVVVFALPEDPATLVVDRVLAVGGERIEIRNQVVLINGQPLAHDWAKPVDPQSEPMLVGDRDSVALNFGPAAVPPGTFFAVGDNRFNSYDSRFYGPVPNENLRGKPLYLYWAKDRSRIGERIR